MRLYSLKGINEEYGITISMLKKLITNRQMTIVKIGNKNFIKKTDIEDYINRNTREAVNV